MREYDTTWVCTDCYFAHHYGATEVDGEWFAGESDTPADREPLALLDGFELADNTDSETGEGIDEFSWRACGGCGTLGGARYRLALFTPRRTAARARADARRELVAGHACVDCGAAAGVECKPDYGCEDSSRR